MKNNERVPLLQYWTTRYLITLAIGLIIMGVISTFLIRYNASQKRMESLKLLAEEIAERVVDAQGQLGINPFLPRDIERRQRFLGLGNLSLVIVDGEGNLVFSRLTLPHGDIVRNITINWEQNQSVRKLNLKPGMSVYLVKQPIKYEGDTLGNVFILHPVQEMPRSTEEYQLLIIMLSGVALLGWIIIFSFTRNLSKPVKDVAEAAKLIVAGNYDIKLNKNIKELELYELISSFKEMAERLRQLEALRTELLAGVTHELKTPVTSISGLLQAVKDEVVTGEEAKDFLEICGKETAKLQKMVEDLLDYNSFATGDIKVNKENHNLNQLLKEIIYQWSIGQDENRVTVNTNFQEDTLYVATDAMRLQQIFYNLFNNAKQAIADGGMINVTLYRQAEEIMVEIEDNGTGIPEDEQELVFERFYRGREKKNLVRGLGLGLSFSKMIARALGGDLLLKKSSSAGTTITIILRG